MSFNEELEDKSFDTASQSDFKPPKKEAKPKGGNVLYKGKKYDSLEALKKDLKITKIGLDRLIKHKKVVVKH